jgi:hypothetical protein
MVMIVARGKNISYADGYSCLIGLPPSLRAARERGREREGGGTARVLQLPQRMNTCTFAVIIGNVTCWQIGQLSH